MIEECRAMTAVELRGAIGKPVEEIETPALVVDLDLMEKNMDKMMEFLSRGTVGIRPHAKSHKTPQIAKMQMDRGALGITCAKLGEAEAMADGGIKDIMIASQVVGTGKIKRAVVLSKRIDLKVAVDSMDNLREISAASAAGGGDIGIIVELEVGLRRCGARSPEEAARLAKAAASLPGVHFAGIMGYEGHCVFIPDLEERRLAAGKAYRSILDTRDYIKKAEGLDSGVVSTGGTGTFMLGGRVEGMTDIEAGSYIFMDARYSGIEGVDFQQSLSVLSTIVSHPTADFWVSDAGIKSMSEEFGPVTILPSYGLTVTGMSEEHIKLEPSVHEANPLPSLESLDQRYVKRAREELRVGDKVHLIPSHCCTTVNLHDVMYAVRDGVVEDVWAITGRGKFA